MQILSFLLGVMTLASSSTSTMPEDNQIRAEMASSSIKQLIVDRGQAKGLSEAKIGQILATVECESHYRNIQSQIFKGGIQEDSWGIVQIHLPSWKNITREQALDIEFAVSFIVDKFSNGDEYLWSCYRKLFK